MKKLIVLLCFLSTGFILTGCAIQPQQNVRQPDNASQQPFLHQPYGGAPISRHDQRYNPQLANW